MIFSFFFGGVAVAVLLRVRRGDSKREEEGDLVAREREEEGEEAVAGRIRRLIERKKRFCASQ